MRRASHIARPAASLLLLTVATVSTAVPEGSAQRAYYSSSEPRWDSAEHPVPDADAPPVFSSTGEEVVFQSTREEGIAQIWAVAVEDGALRRLTDGTYSAGHPDTCALDDRLVFVSDREAGRQIWLLEAGGAAVRRLTRGGRPKSWPAFSPDCRRIAFVEMRDYAAGVYDLRLLELDTGRIGSVLERVRHLGWPRWSADGGWILFHREIEGEPNHIWRARPDGTGVAALTSGTHGDYWGADVSRDGRWIAYSYSPREQLQWGADADVWVADLRTGACRQITDGWWHEHGQRLSPDGRRLVRWDARTGYLEIFVDDLISGESRPLTDQPATELTRLARREGSAAALDFAASRPTGEALFTEAAMRTHLRSLARRAAEPEVELARLLVERHPDSTRARAALARELFRAGDLEEAAQLYRLVAADRPVDGAVASRLDTLDRLLGAPPAGEATVNGLGYRLLRSGFLDQATDVFAWNVRAHPASANAYDSLGEALYWQGELTAAEAAYARALEGSPGSANAARFLRRIRSERAAPPGARRPEMRLPCPDVAPLAPRRPETPDWATVLEWRPDPAVVADAEVRRRIVDVGAPWRVVDRASGIEMLLVPPGSYLRGAAPDDPYDRQNERPRHRVEISRAFYLGRYEVTNAEMRRFRPEHDSGSFYRAEDLTLDDDRMPAVDVSWLDAVAFAEHFGLRLPTEGEWEYAARAGVTARYPWGNDPEGGQGWGNGFNEAVKGVIPAMDWTAFTWDDGYVVSSPVGVFRPNAWGFYDMFGNAWEWCRDSYRDDEYSRLSAPVVDPVATGEDRRTLRGGGWGNAPRGSGIPYRFGMAAGEPFDGNGFRVARALD